MITSSQTISVLIGATAISGFSALVYWVQEVLSIDHRERLKFLKIGLVLTWLMPIISSAVLLSSSSKAIGTLMPGSAALNRVFAASNASVYVFEGETSHATQILLGVYLAGLLLMLVRFLVAYLHMRQILLHSSRATINGRVVRSSEIIASPFSFGFLNPQIFVPAKFVTDQPPKVVEVMLAHEETHVASRDPQWKLISLLMKSALFFAPTTIYLPRKLELEMEVECDRATMKSTATSTSEYGNLLIDTVVATQNLIPNPMFAYMSDTNLKRRIQAMKTRTFKKPVLTAVLGGALLLTGITAVAASAGTAKFKGQYKVKAQILLDGKVVSSPQFIVLPNEPASIEWKSENPQAALRMMLTAADYSSVDTAGIDLKMAVDFKTADHSFRANPRVVVMPGEEGTFTIGSDDSETLEMKITAERQ
jgi:beta-lactamase regulating signal transducer with metallopeptidase domain